MIKKQELKNWIDLMSSAQMKQLIKKQWSYNWKKNLNNLMQVEKKPNQFSKNAPVARNQIPLVQNKTSLQQLLFGLIIKFPQLIETVLEDLAFIDVDPIYQELKTYMLEKMPSQYQVFPDEMDFLQEICAHCLNNSFLEHVKEELNKEELNKIWYEIYNKEAARQAEKNMQKINQDLKNQLEEQFSQEVWDKIKNIKKT